MPTDAQVALVRVVVDEPDDGVGGVVGRVDEASDLVAGVPGAVDDDPNRLVASGSPAVVPEGGAECPAAGGHENEGEGRHGERDAAREDGLREEEDGSEHDADARDEHAQSGHLVEAADPAAPEVQVEGEPPRHLERDGRGHVADHRLPDPIREHEVVTGEDERRECDHPAQSVPGDQDGSLEVHV